MHDFNLRAPQGANRKKRMVGRGQGTGRGTTSGRGNKGQKARSGGKTYVGFEGGQMPLFRQLPRRGFSNHPFKKTYQVVNLLQIEKRYKDGETVSTVTLREKGLIKGPEPVKILANGKLTKKLTLKVKNFSLSAKEKIENAGGTVLVAGGSSETASANI